MNLQEQTLPSSTAPALLLSPRADLFALRAARLQYLAEGHPLGAWLKWLAELSFAQQRVLEKMPVMPLPAVFEAQQPVLGTVQALLQQIWPACYRELQAAMQIAETDWCDAELASRGSRCLQLAAGEAHPQPRDRADILVAAAMQVVWTGAVRQLALPEMTALAHRESCPCCGSAAVGSIVLAGEGKGGLRYLECSLCATRWNAVRARCTLCDSGAGVNYLGLEGSKPAVQAETCDQCHGYGKTFFQDKERLVDPVADDLASLALDVLVGEQGYARATPNLFLIEGEPA